MAITEVRITGLGGQGVILCGYIIGKAASIHNDQHATLTQSFGPEARGSACSAQVVVSDERVLYPYVTAPSVMVAMSHDGYMTYRDRMAERSTLVYDSDLVKPDETGSGRVAYGIPATSFAEEIGRKIVSNIIMLGFFGSISGILPREALQEAVKSSVPPGTEALNLKAFERGYEYGLELKQKPGKQVESKAAPVGS